MTIFNSHFASCIYHSHISLYLYVSWTYTQSKVPPFLHIIHSIYYTDAHITIQYSFYYEKSISKIIQQKP
jgi:hypothetical protein